MHSTFKHSYIQWTATLTLKKGGAARLLRLADIIGTELRQDDLRHFPARGKRIVLRNFHHTLDIANNGVAIIKMADRAVRPASTAAKPQEEGGGKVPSVRNQSHEPY
jgi:hypothetical protein